MFGFSRKSPPIQAELRQRPQSRADLNPTIGLISLIAVKQRSDGIPTVIRRRYAIRPVG